MGACCGTVGKKVTSDNSDEYYKHFTIVILTVKFPII